MTQKAPHDIREIQRLLYKMNVCGCGTDGAWEVIKIILERRGEGDNWGKSYYEGCDDASGRWVEFAAKVLDSWGLLEHGGGIGGAWLTDEGKIVRDFLREYGTDDNEWPEWGSHAESCTCDSCLKGLSHDQPPQVASGGLDR